MIKPGDVASDVWDTLSAAAAGDAAMLARLFERDPNLYRAGYWYALPIDFAVREGHLDAVHVLLEAGADPAAVSFWGEDLVTVARDRGHEAVARLLEQACARRGRFAPARTDVDHPIHAAAAACSSRTAPTPTARSTLRATRPTPPARPSCARCCSRTAARSTRTTSCGWASTTRSCAA